ncbi:hypothetical protein CVT24_011089 [Panaeolus cyanescens]|uniref:RING-type domain-containing protein n=1 Tax=Panaeolus cyanescens TaxID=181874 RepID=A0A409YVK6_9AGAR|nr:hypothetical protein CVT24_011089 [Panaeolus cyanescens]
MLTCRICLEDLQRPVSLPCGHIFCTQCIVKSVQAVQSYTALHNCPICRSLYNIAPLNPSVVPAHLRPFVTPSIRRVFLDPSDQEKELPKDSETPPVDDAAAELQRLRTENAALRNQCGMWRKRAEMHGSANLGLLNFARAVRDQASQLAREKLELEGRYLTLKRKAEEDRSSTVLPSFSESFLRTSSPDVEHVSPVAESLLFASATPPALQQRKSSLSSVSEDACIKPSRRRSSSKGLEPPRKRQRLDAPELSPLFEVGSSFDSIAVERISC